MNNTTHAYDNAQQPVESHDSSRNPRCPHCEKPLRMPLGALPQVIGCISCRNAVLFLEADMAPIAAPGQPDVRSEAANGTVAERVFAAVPARLDSLPVLPGVFQQVLALIHDPISDLDDIVSAVERDATLTLHLLKVANSAMYRGTSHIDEARTACVRLGMKEIANVVWRVQCAAAFRCPRQELSDRMNAIWNRSVATGFCARALARATQSPDAEMAFLAGLTHAVGQTLLVQILATEPDFAIQRLSEHEDRYLQLMDRYGPLLGMLVLQHWGMPPAVLASTLYQRAPHLAPTPASCRLGHQLVLGIALARQCGFAQEGDREVDERRERVSCLALGLVPEQLAELSAANQEDVVDFVGSMMLA